MRMLDKSLTESIYRALNEEEYGLPTDEDIENEVEKYRTSQLDKITKHEQDDEVKHQEMLNYFKQQKKDYLKNRKDSLKKYREENEPTEDKLNAKREELRQKREKDREDHIRWFNKAKEDNARYFSDVNALTDLRDMENPGNFLHGGFDVRFTYNGKSYAIAWYDSEAYCSDKDGYYELRWCGEIPTDEVHKGFREPEHITEMRPEEFGLTVKPGNTGGRGVRVKGIIDLDVLGGKPRETSNEAIAKELDSLGESASNTKDFIKELNKYKKEYCYGHSDKDDSISASVENILDELPVGTVFYTNYKETVSGYTFWGGYSHEYARIIEYRKDEDGWKRDGTPKTTEEVMISVLHSSSDIRTKEEAGKAQEEMKGELKSTRTEYAPKSNVAPDNPHWDGNRYGI